MSQNSKILPLFIRADAGADIGTGHVMRMIALAQGWVDRLALDRDAKAFSKQHITEDKSFRGRSQVVFVCAKLPEALEKRLKDEGFTVARINSIPGSEEDLRQTLAVTDDYRRQIADSEEENSLSATGNSQSSQSKQQAIPWLVVDGYHFDFNYQKGVKENSNLSLLCVDDYGYSDHWYCDAILNQNLDAEKRINYQTVFPGTKMLLGASFCLLRREFRQAQRLSKSWGRIQKLLVTLGGSDPDNATGAVLQLLNQACARPLEIRVLLGLDNPHLKSIQAFESHHQIEILQGVSNMPDQYAWAEGIISAGGSTCWEWLYFGLPGAIVTIANNQVPIVEALTKSHLAALSLGWFHNFDSRGGCQKLTDWLNHPKSQVNSSEAEFLIDGYGSTRVATALNSMLSITIATTKKSWMCDLLSGFISDLEADGYKVTVVHEAKLIPAGDVLFLLSFWSLLPAEILTRNTHNIVVHESALPEGRGWSPVTWQILEGKNEIPVVLFEAKESMDSGQIYLESTMNLTGLELVDEIRHEQARVTFELCRKFLNDYPAVLQKARSQNGIASNYPRRRPEDSRLDPEKTFAAQFNLLRVVDNEAYPAYFEYKGAKYILKIYPDEL